MTGRGRGGKEKSKPTTQSKLTDFGALNAEQANKEANAISTEASPKANKTNPAAVMGADEGAEVHLAKDEILGAIQNLKSEFTGRFDGIMKAIDETRREMSECTERVTQAETRLSNLEDEQLEFKAVIAHLQKRNKELETNVVNLEMRSRLNNLRLVGLPEGSEGPDVCKFLEGWLPDALDLDPLRSPLELERAHRIGPKRDAATPPRTVIMRFLDYRQRAKILQAVKSKKEIFYKNYRVRLYTDVATEMHRQRKQFDEVRDQLRQLGVRHGILSPCTLVLTYKEKVHRFKTSAEAKVFVGKIQADTNGSK